MTPFLSLAKKISKRSPHKSFTHAALIFKHGSMLSWGFNHMNEHAETDALARVPWISEARGATVLVVRTTKGQNLLANSKPCEACQRALKAAGIKNVLYSTAERQIERMKL
jgi:deoxycytidylate deaminase